jgi:hypothetical protein
LSQNEVLKMENFEKCRVRNCEESKQGGDLYFCEAHRGRWRKYCYEMNVAYRNPYEEDLDILFKRFCMRESVYKIVR